VTFGHEAARLLAHDPARPQPGSPGYGPAADIAALIDAGEQPLDRNLTWFPIRTYLCAGRRI
jgi:hypothetical protein